jgi:hypothetical protein
MVLSCGRLNEYVKLVSARNSPVNASVWSGASLVRGLPLSHVKSAKANGSGFFAGGCARTSDDCVPGSVVGPEISCATACADEAAIARIKVTKPRFIATTSLFSDRGPTLRPVLLSV